MSAGASRVILSAIDFSPISDLQNQNRQHAVPNVAKNPEIAHAIAPKIAQRSLQRFAQPARIITRSDAFVHEIHDAPRDRLVEFP